MKVVVKEPGKAAEERDVPNELDALQQLVGGYIETAQFSPGILAVFNEEGKLRGLTPNLRAPLDTLVGPVVFVGGPVRSEMVSLTTEQVSTVMSWCEQHEV